MYKIVYAEEKYLVQALLNVESEVNRLKEQGWVEQGGISVSNPTEAYDNYCVVQAMVEKDE